MDEVRKIGIDVQTKFDFYLLALTFTILGLAVQTATDVTELLCTLVELASWVLFLLSGIFGLYRLAWLPVGYILEADYDVWKSNFHLARSTPGNVHLLSTEEQRRLTAQEERDYLESCKNKIANLNSMQERHEKRHNMSWTAQHWCFTLGLAFLIGSRGWAALLKLAAAQ